MIWKDEIVEEVRRVREEHAARFNYDISAICADIRRQQAESGRKVVSKQKKVKKQSELLKVA